MPEDMLACRLIGAPASRTFVRQSATPPPRFDSCMELVTAEPIDSKLSSTRSKKHDTSAPDSCLPRLEKVGVAGWKRPVMISSATARAAFSSPRASPKAFMTTRSS